MVKVFNKDDSAKTMMIDERMTVRTVMKQLVEKNHFDSSANWALIEELPSLYMGELAINQTIFRFCFTLRFVC